MSKKTLKTIAKLKNAEAIIQVKANQPKLLDNCEEITKTKPSDEYFNKQKPERNRIEERRAQVFFIKNLSKSLKNKLGIWSNYIKTVIKVERETEKFNTKKKLFEKSIETSYYISTSNKLNAEEFATTIRNHWSIENRNHCVRDISLNEDKSRIRKNPQVFAILRSFALNVLRNNNVENVGETIYRNALNIRRVFGYKDLF